MSVMLFLVAVIGFMIFLGGAALLATAIYHVRKEALDSRREDAEVSHDDRMAA